MRREVLYAPAMSNDTFFPCRASRADADRTQPAQPIRVSEGDLCRAGLNFASTATVTATRCSSGNFTAIEWDGGVSLPARLPA